MKILLIVNHLDLKQQLLCHFAETGDLVVSVGAANGINLLEEIARTTPHALVLAVPILNEDESAIVSFVEREFLDLLVVRLTTTLWGDALASGWEELLARELASEVPVFIAHDYACGQRLVFHNDAFNEFTRGDKLKQPRRDEHYEVILEEQRNRFQLLLEGSRQHHQDATNYYEALRHHLMGLELEITYGSVHNSYKSLIWSRDLVGKLCAAVAHYVPGVELLYLPKPAGLHPQLDYVSYEMPVEAEYAIRVVISLCPNRAITELLLAATRVVFVGQSDHALLQETSTWLGLAQVMTGVVEAHLAQMERYQNETSPACDHRLAHRQRGVFRDFWDLNHLLPRDQDGRDIATIDHMATYPKIPTFWEVLRSRQ
jgi:hypothetical protein